MLNEYAYCPRLAYLEWVQAEFEDSSDTVEGRLRHRRVDQGKGDLPSTEACLAVDQASLPGSRPGVPAWQSIRRPCLAVGQASLPGSRSGVPAWQ
ncbi:MAG TPA: hypothetical protein PLQ35_17260, partial [bacterium]|nr:hypothetical protein [bacterium]